MFGLPTDEQEIIRHYTLTPTDFERLFQRHGPANQLRAALQFCLLRHPGFGLRPDEDVPEPVMRYLTARLNVPETAYQGLRSPGPPALPGSSGAIRSHCTWLNS